VQTRCARRCANEMCKQDVQTRRANEMCKRDETCKLEETCKRDVQTRCANETRRANETRCANEMCKRDVQTRRANEMCKRDETCKRDEMCKRDARSLVGYCISANALYCCHSIVIASQQVAYAAVFTTDKSQPIACLWKQSLPKLSCSKYTMARITATAISNTISATPLK